MQPLKSNSDLRARANMVETQTCKTHTRTRQYQRQLWPTRRIMHRWCLRSSEARCAKPEAMYRTCRQPRMSLWVCPAIRSSNLTLEAKAHWFLLRRLTTTTTKLGRNSSCHRWLVSSNQDKPHQARVLSLSTQATWARPLIWNVFSKKIQYERTRMKWDRSWHKRQSRL